MLAAKNGGSLFAHLYVNGRCMFKLVVEGSFSSTACDGKADSRDAESAILSEMKVIAILENVMTWKSFVKGECADSFRPLRH